MGIVEVPTTGFGLEAAGIVRRIGPHVKGLNVGDRVILLGYDSFSTLITTAEDHCVRIPDNLSFDEGATIPAVFLTAIYSLFNVGGLAKGQVGRLFTKLFELNLTQSADFYSLATDDSHPQCVWWSRSCSHPALADGRG